MTRTAHAVSPPNDPAPGWGESLYTGAAGIALLHIEDAHTGAGDWASVHEWAAAMTCSSVTAHPDACGLYRGAPAVAFALHAADRPAYATALGILDGHIATVTRHRLEHAHERIDRGHLPALREFDLIRGLTGIGVYLLHRHGGGDLLAEVLSYLVRLTEPLTAGCETLPGWWSGNGPDDRPSPDWPGGHGNLGMAHGIAGPLALLSTATNRGISVAGAPDAIGWICAWLDQWCCGTGRRAWWPGRISASERRAGAVRQCGPQRPSWCYGTPGLARAQQVAALALADPRRQRRAEQALAGCLADDRQLALLGDASLCHGWAGVLQATWRAAADGDGRLAACLPNLLRGMEEHLRRHGPPDHSGLLDGTAGVELVRYAIAAHGPPASGWDACLLLNG